MAWLTQDPEVAAAFADISQNPANMSKYANNAKIQNLIKNMQGKFAGAGPDGDDTDMPGTASGAAPTSSSAKPSPHVPHQPDID